MSKPQQHSNRSTVISCYYEDVFFMFFPKVATCQSQKTLLLPGRRNKKVVKLQDQIPNYVRVTFPHTKIGLKYSFFFLGNPNLGIVSSTFEFSPIYLKQKKDAVVGKNFSRFLVFKGKSCRSENWIQSQYFGWVCFAVGGFSEYATNETLYGLCCRILPSRYSIYFWVFWGQK